MAVIDITEYDLLAVHGVLQEIQNTPGPVQFTLTVAKLLDLFTDPVEAIRARGVVPQDLSRQYQDYESARIMLSRAHAQQDDAGNPLTDHLGFFILKDAAAFEAALTKLQTDGPLGEAYQAVTRRGAEWKAATQSTYAEIPKLLDAAHLPRLAASVIPATVVARQLHVLLPLIDDDK